MKNATNHLPMVMNTMYMVCTISGTFITFYFIVFPFKVKHSTVL